MPEISRFLGVIIYMYFNDHNPPHFHVKYKKYRAAIDIKHAQIIEGHLPKKIFTIIKKWTIINEEQLIKNWLSLKEKGTFNKIKPLL